MVNDVEVKVVIEPRRFINTTVVVAEDEDAEDEDAIAGRLQYNYDKCSPIIMVGITADYKVVEVGAPDVTPWTLISCSLAVYDSEEFYAVTKIDDTWFYLYLEESRSGQLNVTMRDELLTEIDLMFISKAVEHYHNLI